MLTWIFTGSPRSSTNPKAKSCWMLCGKKRWPNILLLESTTFWKASSTDDGRYRPVSASTLDYSSFSFPFSDMFTVRSFGFLSRHLLHFPGSTIRYPSIFTRIANLFSELAMTVPRNENRYRVDMHWVPQQDAVFRRVTERATGRGAHPLAPIRYAGLKTSRRWPCDLAEPVRLRSHVRVRRRMRVPQVGEPRGIETRVPPSSPAPRQASLLTSARGGQSCPRRHPCQKS